MKNLTKKQLNSQFKVNCFFRDLFLSIHMSPFAVTDYARYIFSESTRLLVITNISFRSDYDALIKQIRSLYTYYLAVCQQYNYQPFELI